MALERLKRKLTTENLWIHILSALKKRDMYGYEIANMLRKEMKIKAAVITVYTVLYKMEREGLIMRKSGGGLNLRKIYYGITDKGIGTLNEGIIFLKDLLSVVSSEG